jgi:hypothetical protein
MEDIQTLLNNAKQLTEDGNIKVNKLETVVVSPAKDILTTFSVVIPFVIVITNFVIQEGYFSHMALMEIVLKQMHDVKFVHHCKCNSM